MLLILLAEPHMPAPMILILDEGTAICLPLLGGNQPHTNVTNYHPLIRDLVCIIAPCAHLQWTAIRIPRATLAHPRRRTVPSTANDTISTRPPSSIQHERRYRHRGSCAPDPSYRCNLGKPTSPHRRCGDVCPFATLIRTLFRGWRWQYLRHIKNIEAIIEESKSKMCEFMAKNNIKSIQSEMYSITMVPAGTTSRFNKDKLLRDHPEINEGLITPPLRATARLM